MFAKYLISSIESLYMQMIPTNCINNNIPGSESSALVQCPGFAELQTTPRVLLPGMGLLANAKETGGNQTGEEGRAAKRAGAVLSKHKAGHGAATGVPSTSAGSGDPRTGS